MKKCNYSVGLRIYCADRKINSAKGQKSPLPQAIFNGFLLVTVKVLNSYEEIFKSQTKSGGRADDNDDESG